jgi:hypothetical protein
VSARFGENGACTASRLARPYPPARLAHRIDLELMTCVCGHWVGKISFPAPNGCDLSKSAARGSAVG